MFGSWCGDPAAACLAKAAFAAHENVMSDDKKSPDEGPKRSTANKAAIGAAATIGSAAIAAALLYAGRRFGKRSSADEKEAGPPGTVPSGEPPETD
jgi:hypothetical protein